MFLGNQKIWSMPGSMKTWGLVMRVEGWLTGNGPGQIAFSTLELPFSTVAYFLVLFLFLFFSYFS